MAHPAPLRRHDENGNSLNAGAAEHAEGGRQADGIRDSGFAARGPWLAARGPPLAACGPPLAARGPWLAARGSRLAGDGVAALVSSAWYYIGS